MKTNGILEQLPQETLETVLSYLDPQALTQLHIAAGGNMPAVKQRMLAMQCGRHWLQLSHRLASQARPPPGIIPTEWAEGEEEASEAAEEAALAATAAVTSAEPFAEQGEEAGYSKAEAAGFSEEEEQQDAESQEEVEHLEAATADLAAAAHAAGEATAQSGEKDSDSLLHCSKHDLLQTLHSQVRHINDVAALIFHWTALSYLGWDCELRAVGIPCDFHFSRNMDGNRNTERLVGLGNNIRQALLLNQNAFVDFYNNKEDPNNKFREFVPFCRK